MANQVALEDVTSSESTGDTSSPAETEVTETAPESDTPVEKSDEGSTEIGAEESTEGTDQTSEVATQTEEKPQTETVQKINVGGKDYTLEEIEDTLQKKSFYQSDRDKAEYTVSRLVKQLNAAGLTVDSNMNVVPAEKPVGDKRELAERAVAGDIEAMNKLLELNSIETENRVQRKIGEYEGKKEMLSQVRKRFPDMYNEDGSPNMSSPLSIESSKIINKYPHLGSYENILVVAELAEARLLRGNVKNIEQGIINKTLQKAGKSASAQTAKPSTSTAKPPVKISDGVLRSAQKLGSNADRISKIVARAQKEGGYFLD